CMMHCGFEATAVNDTLRHPLRALKVALRGPHTDGPLAPELPTLYAEPPPPPAGVPLTFHPRPSSWQEP
ncbi:MAG: DUF3463 domain-containing protein, partial [Pseudomonadota bacterium]|nr:DUF3463 domain-containing protein [Pseudomonadota bacterium]